MLLPAIEIDEWVVGRHWGPSAQRRLHQTGSACSRPAGAAGCTAGTRAGSARSESAHAAAGRALNDAGIHTAKKSSRLRTQNVGLRDRKIVSSDCQVQVIFQREIDRIF